jgi:hypothetical protein
MMKWNHIMDCQPEHGRKIIKIEPPYRGHYNMGMVTYSQNGPFQDYVAYLGFNPDYWWVYAEDFPFPDKEPKDE